MKIQSMTCPRCGAEIPAAGLNKINYCSYCGASLYIDDGIHRSYNTTIIRDEARIKEAENAARKLDLEEQRLQHEQQQFQHEQQQQPYKKTMDDIGKATIMMINNTFKSIVSIIGILFIFVFGLIYLISPVDLLPGIIFDDIAIIGLCWWLKNRIDSWN